MKISEIAQLAGVSPAAVSRYINGGSISEEKSQKIKKVIEETGYVPNLAARSLRQQRSLSIGIIVPKFNSDSVSNLIEGVSSVLNKAGYMAIFGNAENDEKREVEYMRLMQESNLAGILLMGTVFTPKHPKTKPILEKILQAEKALETDEINVNEMMERAVSGTKTSVITPGK